MMDENMESSESILECEQSPEFELESPFFDPEKQMEA